MEEKTLLQDMSVGEWLNRLNYPHLIKGFHDYGVFKVEDMALIEHEGTLYSLGVKEYMERKRIMGMLEGKETHVESFKYLTEHQCRTVIQNYVRNPQQIEQLVKEIPEKSVTGFQLQDIFDVNHSLEAVYKSFKERLAVSEEIGKGVYYMLQKENEEDIKKKDKEKKDKDFEKRKEKSVPKFEIEILLKELGLEDRIDKLKEHDLLDPQIFWKLEESKFENLIEIKVFGVRKRLMKRIEQIKKQHKENFEKEDDVD